MQCTKLAASALTALWLSACATAPEVTTPQAFTPAQRSLGADGWASGTTGGAAADAAHQYIVSDRAELLAALANQGQPDAPKIIQIRGAIDLLRDESGRTLDVPDFTAGTGFDVAQYRATFDPKVWPLGKPIPADHPQELLRRAAARKQAAHTVLNVGANTTLLGLGRDARIVNGSLLLKGTRNVVIRNIEFQNAVDLFPAWDPKDDYNPANNTGGRWNAEYDLVQIMDSSQVWIDHCTFNDGDSPDLHAAADLVFGQVFQQHDGAVDITRASDQITLSWNHFHDHDKTTLIGGSDTAKPENGYGKLGVTLHHNRYENVTQRLPRVRFGKVHVYNNLYQGTLGEEHSGGYPFLYALGVGQFARLYAEQNLFELSAPAGAAAPTAADLIAVWHKAGSDSTYFQDRGSRLNGQPVDLNAAVASKAAAAGKPVVGLTETVWTPASQYAYRAQAAESLRDALLAGAGAGKL